MGTEPYKMNLTGSYTQAIDESEQYQFISADKAPQVSRYK